MTRTWPRTQCTHNKDVVRLRFWPVRTTSIQFSLGVHYVVAVLSRFATGAYCVLFRTVFISQLIRYARACSSYECFILRARRLSSKLLKQGYLVERFKSSFKKFYGRYGDLVEQYGVTLSRMLNDILTLDQQWLPYRSDFPPISWPLYRAWPSPNYEWFPWSICNGCG